MYSCIHLQSRLRQWCRENEYCLRFCLEGIKDSNTCVSVNDIAELESKYILLYYEFGRISNSWVK